MDSSCFLKLFLAESGTQEMIVHVDRSEDRTMFVSVLAAVEVRSAIRRKQLQGDVIEPDAELALTLLQEETRRIVEQPMTEPVLGIANEVIDRHSLRALDSIQLASALTVRESLPRGAILTFIAADRRLLTAASHEGLEVWNPAKSET